MSATGEPHEAGSGREGNITSAGPAAPSSPEDVPFAPLSGEEPQGAVLECPLCGGKFTHGRQVCAACPLNAGCDLIRCPRCGYQYPRTSRVAEWFKGGLRFLRRKR